MLNQHVHTPPSFQDDEPETGGGAVHSELDPNSDDDIEEGEDEEGVKDLIICQFDKVRDRRWKGWSGQ